MCDDSRTAVVFKNKTQFYAQKRRAWKENVPCGYFWVGHYEPRF